MTIEAPNNIAADEPRFISRSAWRLNVSKTDLAVIIVKTIDAKVRADGCGGNGRPARQVPAQSAQSASRDEKECQQYPQPGQPGKSQSAPFTAGFLRAYQRRIYTPIKRGGGSAGRLSCRMREAHGFSIFRGSFTQPAATSAAKAHFPGHRSATLNAKLLAW